MVKTYPNPNPNGRPLIDCPKCGERKESHAKGYCYHCYRKYIWKAKVIKCKECGRMRPHKAYGLCSGCHMRLHHYDKVKAYNAMKHHGIELDKLKEFTKRCVNCGFDKCIELHHLDGHTRNNDPKNLVGLCPNCHKMIHSYTYFDEIKDTLGKKGYDVSKIKPALGQKDTDAKYSS